jgi:hypothetical protein
MSENADLEEFSRTCFEDEADLLEFVHEKIENSVFLWTLWCKAFAPEMGDEVSRALAVEFMTEIHKDIVTRVRVQVDVKEAGNVLSGFIRKYRTCKEPNDSRMPE